MSRLSSTVLDLPGFAVTLIMIVLGGMFVGCNQQAYEAAYRTIDQAFVVRQSQGWELTKAPEDGKRYRVCGATESGMDPNRHSFSGRIESGDRFVDFNVAIPDERVVAVEGLDSLGGGPLSYAVLTKDLPAGNVTPPSVNHSLENQR
ncbi:hypothetical protein [Thalassoglobus neptunius]|nr:hypothetical protein [Thalassoglobus neptunius]